MLSNKNIKAFIRSSLSALLCFVIAFNLSFNTFHIQSEDHHHTGQTCTPDEENDACHRYLIHHEKSHSCKGEHEHLTGKSENCFTCNYFKNLQPCLKGAEATHSASVFSLLKYALEITTLKTSFSFSVFSRGPPLIS